MLKPIYKLLSSFIPDIKKREKYSVLLLCIFIAGVFWLVNAFSKFYTERYTFKVEYHNYPENKVLVNTPPKEVNISIRSSGWYLFGLRFKGLPSNIKIDLSKLQNSKLETEALLNQFTKQLSRNYKIVKISPNKIDFSFDKKKYKTVPVKQNLNISIKKQFGIVGDIKIMPSNIKISGTENVLSDILYWETDTLSLQELSEPFRTKLALKPSKHNTLQPLQDSVEIIVNVEEFTEGSIISKIEGVNVPEGKSIIFYPKEVTVKYITSLSKFDEIDAYAFETVINYDHIDFKNNLAKIELASTPENTKNVQLTPQEVEYIIYE